MASRSFSGPVTARLPPGPGPTVGRFPSAAALADFDGDGIQDLAVANAGSGDVSILVGRCSGPPRLDGDFRWQ